MTTKGRARYAMRSTPLRELRPVQLPSIADELDRIDPRIPRGRVASDREQLPADDDDQEEEGQMINRETVQRSSQRVKAIHSGGNFNGKGKGRGGVSGLQIPKEFRELVPDIEYFCELSEDGILFRPAHLFNATRPLPTWANKNGHK